METVINYNVVDRKSDESRFKKLKTLPFSAASVSSLPPSNWFRIISRFILSQPAVLPEFPESQSLAMVSNGAATLWCIQLALGQPTGIAWCRELEIGEIWFYDKIRKMSERKSCGFSISGINREFQFVSAPAHTDRKMHATCCSIQCLVPSASSLFSIYFRINSTGRVQRQKLANLHSISGCVESLTMHIETRTVSQAACNHDAKKTCLTWAQLFLRHYDSRRREIVQINRELLLSTCKKPSKLSCWTWPIAMDLHKTNRQTSPAAKPPTTLCHPVTFQST